MKLLWHGNAPWSPTGYGNQIRTFLPLLHEAGAETYVSSNFGLAGAPLNTPHGVVLPRGLDDWGNDILPMHWQHLKPDVVWLLCDIWVMQQDVLRKMPVSAWAPVDHDPIPPAVANNLHVCRWPVSFSKFGEREMRKAGLDPFYVPHGVDTDFFKPEDRARCRQSWQVPEDAFFVIMVAANKGNPSRKSLDRVLKAWAKFCETHPDAILYLHTLPYDYHHGWNLPTVAAHYGIRAENVRFPDTYHFLTGRINWDAMVALYGAADVLLAPSMGEGFGIPVIEAQACGCPVVVTDATAQSELCGAGYTIPVDRFNGLTWTYQNSEQAWLAPSDILTSLEWAFDQRGNEDLRKQARTFAVQYDAKRVFDRYMWPVMQYMAEANHAELLTFYEAADEPPQTTQEVAA